MVTLVSILSAEKIWLSVPSSDTNRQKKLENIKKEFSVPNSDHLSLINVYNEWKRNGYKDSWASKNFILLRAMKNIRNIKDQLEEVLDKVTYDNIKDYFKSATGDTNTHVERKFRRCLTEGFYMNVARKISSNSEGQYITADEQVMVKVDKWTCFEMNENYPDWILYTELAGSASGNKGIIRLASEIKVKWIEKKLPKLQQVDMKRLELAGESPKINNKRKAMITMNDLESLIEQKRKEGKIVAQSYCKIYDKNFL